MVDPFQAINRSLERSELIVQDRWACFGLAGGSNVHPRERRATGAPTPAIRCGWFD
jgi:hypothetical protein